MKKSWDKKFKDWFAIKIQWEFRLKKQKRKMLAQFFRVVSFRNLEKIFFSFLLLFSLLAALLIGYTLYKFDNLEDIEALDNYNLYEVPTTVYDVKGRKITEFFLYKREIIAFEDISKKMIHTLLEAEDKTFFEHGGIDFLGILRAFGKNIQAGSVRQGGSTITQQLAKLLFTNRERSITRKIREFWLTLQIEKKYTKSEILEKYLNKVYYGNNQYGLEAASHFYFGKNSKELNYAECAFLVAIPPAPSFLNPLRYPLRTQDRQRVILNILVRGGYLSKNEMERQVKDFWLSFQERLISGAFYDNRLNTENHAPYFSEHIRRELYEIFEEKIYTGGYQIYTTLDIDKQKIAEEALKKKLDEQKAKYQDSAKDNFAKIQEEYPRLLEFLGYAFGMDELAFYKSELENNIVADLAEKELHGLGMVFSSFNMNAQNLLMEERINEKDELELDYIPEGALISLEIPSGRILSMVGGSGYTPFNQLNRATQARRQPGSSFKPFVYLSALMGRNMSAASTVIDRPIAFKIESGDIWVPGNGGTNYQGIIRLRDALRKSVNIVSIKLIEMIGITPVINLTTKLLGLEEDRFRKDFSLALGTSELTPLEILKGYAVFANQGKDVTPHGILKVEDRYGKTIWDQEGELLSRGQKELIPAPYVYLLTDMMRDVIRRGTATQAANMAGFTYADAAGKTGTSSNFRDAWFIGFTPQIATAVWVGFDKGVSLGDWTTGTGGIVAAPVWMEYMKNAVKDYPYKSFLYSGGLNKLTVCAISGMLPGKDCREEIVTGFDDKGEPKMAPGFVEEYFIPGTEPARECDVCEKEYTVTDKELEKLGEIIDK
ncbi:MAG: hypothetical protein CVV50_00350 [Spirochaetae bacterium HGW-Spirochaetae-6]|nr:MAG: hypothetical protein CVV50_00350 [Spirochaetae bacterium HGW-Spirochaetae-6]